MFYKDSVSLAAMQLLSDDYTIIAMIVVACVITALLIYILPPPDDYSNWRQGDDDRDLH